MSSRRQEPKAFGSAFCQCRYFSHLPSMPDMENNTILCLHKSRYHAVETLQTFSKEAGGRGDGIVPSHSEDPCRGPPLGVSTLTSSFSAVPFPPKNKCDTVLTLLSVSPEDMACFIIPGRLVTPSGWSHHFFQKTRTPSPKAGLAVNVPYLFSFLSILPELPNPGLLAFYPWDGAYPTTSAGGTTEGHLLRTSLTHQAGPEATTFSLQGRKPDHSRVVQGKCHSHRQQPTQPC